MVDISFAIPTRQRRYHLGVALVVLGAVLTPHGAAFSSTNVLYRFSPHFKRALDPSDSLDGPIILAALRLDTGATSADRRVGRRARRLRAPVTLYYPARIFYPARITSLPPRHIAMHEHCAQWHNNDLCLSACAFHALPFP